MFTKQHYEAIAEVLKTVGMLNSDFDSGREYIGHALMLLFQEDNPNFNRKRFIEAANLPRD